MLGLPKFVTEPVELAKPREESVLRIATPKIFKTRKTRKYMRCCKFDVLQKANKGIVMVNFFNWFVACNYTATVKDVAGNLIISFYFSI